MERDGMTHEEAIEWMDFNVTGAWLGETTPIFVHDIPSDWEVDEYIEEMEEHAHESMKKVEAAAKEQSANTEEVEIPETIEGKREFIKKQKL